MFLFRVIQDSRKLISAKPYIFNQVDCQMPSLILRNIDPVQLYDSLTVNKDIQ